MPTAVVPMKSMDLAKSRLAAVLDPAGRRTLARQMLDHVLETLRQAGISPVRVADQLMDRLAVPAQGDLVDQFTRDVALPRRRRGLSRLFRGHLFREHRPVRLAAH